MAFVQTIFHIFGINIHHFRFYGDTTGALFYVAREIKMITIQIKIKCVLGNKSKNKPIISEEWSRYQIKDCCAIS